MDNNRTIALPSTDMPVLEWPWTVYDIEGSNTLVMHQPGLPLSEGAWFRFCDLCKIATIGISPLRKNNGSAGFARCNTELVKYCIVYHRTYFTTWSRMRDMFSERLKSKTKHFPLMKLVLARKDVPFANSNVVRSYLPCKLGGKFVTLTKTIIDNRTAKVLTTNLPYPCTKMVDLATLNKLSKRYYGKNDITSTDSASIVTYDDTPFISPYVYVKMGEASLKNYAGVHDRTVKYFEELGLIKNIGSDIVSTEDNVSTPRSPISCSPQTKSINPCNQSQLNTNNVGLDKVGFLKELMRMKQTNPTMRININSLI